MCNNVQSPLLSIVLYLSCRHYRSRLWDERNKYPALPRQLRPMIHAIAAAKRDEGSTCALRMTLSLILPTPRFSFLPHAPAYHAAVVPVAWIHPCLAV